jgi:hypothetical protein
LFQVQIIANNLTLEALETEDLETNRRELDDEIDAVNYQMKRGLVADQLEDSNDEALLEQENY